MIKWECKECGNVKCILITGSEDKPHMCPFSITIPSWKRVKDAIKPFRN